MATSQIDLFISHASEDKDLFVRPLADVLRRAGIRVWYDEYSLRLGDSLRRSLDEGLARCRYAVVVISPAFLQKRWTNWELNGLLQRHLDEGELILPVWLNVDSAAIRKFSPSLADILALRADSGVDAVAADLVQHLRGEENATTISLLPSTVAAVGYWRHFLRPAMTLLLEDDAEAHIDDQVIALRDRKCKFNLICPHFEQNPLDRWSFANSQGLRRLTLTTRSSLRGIAVLTNLSLSANTGSDIIFFDLVTTLHTVYAAVEYALETSQHPLTANHLKRIELANFRRTLRRLIDEEMDENIRTEILIN